jgi:hypothetical protein
MVENQSLSSPSSLAEEEESDKLTTPPHTTVAGVNGASSNDPNKEVSQS